MERSSYERAASPESGEEFGQAMGELCRAAGGDRFAVIDLRGANYDAIARVLHDGNIAASASWDDARHWTIERMVDALRKTGMPFPLGPEGIRLEVPGFEHGAAAITRGDRLACIVVFGRSSPASGDAMFQLLGDTQLAAQYAICGLAALPVRICPLTDRELECLRHYIIGKNAKATALALGISARTVEGHLKIARARCNVDTTLAVSMLAIREGWISGCEIRTIEAAG